MTYTPANNSTKLRKEGLIIGVDMSCLKSSIEISNLNDQKITYQEFVNKKPTLICHECNNVIVCSSLFENEAGNDKGEQKQEKQHSQRQCNSSALSYDYDHRRLGGI